MLRFPKKVPPKHPPAPGREPVVTLEDPKSAMAEAYRTVRTNLQFTGLDQGKRSILVTSAGPGEGKSTTVANLGVTMALGGTRTLLVDSDLRRPVLHKLFQLPSPAGLTTVLTGKTELAPSIAATKLPGLALLPCGPLPPNPAELLASRRMGEVAEALTAQFDLVLYDSPPVISLSDALILSTYAAGVLLVVKGGQYPAELIRQAKAQLEGVKAACLGVLLNSVDFKREGYYYRYYYRYYYDAYGGYRPRPEGK